MIKSSPDKVMETQLRRRCQRLKFSLSVLTGLRVALDCRASQRHRREFVSRVVCLRREKGHDGGGVEAEGWLAGQHHLEKKRKKEEEKRKKKTTWLSRLARSSLVHRAWPGALAMAWLSQIRLCADGRSRT